MPNIIPKITPFMQNLVVFMTPSKYADDISRADGKNV